MSKYTLDLYEDGDRWKAVVPDLLVVGTGSDAASAAADAIGRAAKAEEDLTAHGLAGRTRAGRLRINVAGHDRPRDIAMRTLAGFGVRAAVVAVILLVFTALAAGVARTAASRLQAAIDSNSSPEQLQAKAARIAERLSPAARELRPLIRLLTTDDGSPASPPK